MQVTEEHLIVQGSPLLCDGCGCVVAGVLHRCVNCARHFYFEKVMSGVDLCCTVNLY